MSTTQGPADGCYWQRDFKPLGPVEPLDGDRKVDVAVIGGGYTGLATAYHLKVTDPALDVAVLEGERIGYGASGRNAGFVLTLFGTSAPLVKMIHGKERLREGHEYALRAIDSLEQTVLKNNIDCNFERAGFLRVATSSAYAARIKEEIELFDSIGIGGMEWIDQDAVKERVNGATYVGGCIERDCGTLDPVKWLQGLHKLARDAGATVHENTRVSHVKKRYGGYDVVTKNGTLRADKVVYATNAYSHLIPNIKNTQAAACTYVMATEPLTDAQLASIGWAGREGVEDSRNFMNYYRLTPDNRLLVGGGPGTVPFGNTVNHDGFPKAWEFIENFTARTFPQLKGIKFEYRWGGAFSMTTDFTPQIGVQDGGASVYSVGCTGHGVATTQLNGQVIRDLILDKKTDLTDMWFVNHRALPMPPEPIRSAVAHTVAAAMHADDWWCDRASAAST